MNGQHDGQGKGIDRIWTGLVWAVGFRHGISDFLLPKLYGIGISGWMGDTWRSSRDRSAHVMVGTGSGYRLTGQGLGVRLDGFSCFLGIARLCYLYQACVLHCLAYVRLDCIMMYEYR